MRTIIKNIVNFRLLFSSVALLVLIPSLCLGWSGKVVKVADGDTITVLHDGEQERIRLYGVDAPEKDQAFGQESKEFTASLVAGREVEVQRKDTDRYGRTVALVTVNGRSLNDSLVQEGYAWVYRQYCKESFCSTWLHEENAARSTKKGMWNDPHIIPPWEFRHPKGQQVSGMQSPDKSAASPDIGVNAYHGNTNSHKFHRPTCQQYNCPNCTSVFKSREEAVAKGYEPCGICKP